MYMAMHKKLSDGNAGYKMSQNIKSKMSVRKCSFNIYGKRLSRKR